MGRIEGAVVSYLDESAAATEGVCTRCRSIAPRHRCCGALDVAIAFIKTHAGRRVWQQAVDEVLARIETTAAGEDRS